MKRMKRNLVYIALLVMLLVMLSLITACGSGVNLSASMSGVNESEEASSAVEEDEETAENVEDADFDEEDADDSDEWAEDIDEDDLDTDEAADNSAVDGNTITVILNTNEDRMRIHMPDTSCAGQIHAENYQEWTGTEQELIDFANEYGYVACGRCHPEKKLGIDLPTKK